MPVCGGSTYNLIYGVARMEEGRGVHKVLVGKPEGKRLLGRPRRRWDNIKMDLQEVGKGLWGLDGVDSG